MKRINSHNINEIDEIAYNSKFQYNDIMLKKAITKDSTTDCVGCYFDKKNCFDLGFARLCKVGIFIEVDNES